jgi:hypothetical protein
MMGVRPIANEMARTRLSRWLISPFSIIKVMNNAIHTDITVRRTHGCRSYTKDALDSLTSPAKLCNDLLVSERCKRLEQETGLMQRHNESVSVLHGETRCGH